MPTLRGLSAESGVYQDPWIPRTSRGTWTDKPRDVDDKPRDVDGQAAGRGQQAAGRGQQAAGRGQPRDVDGDKSRSVGEQAAERRRLGKSIIKNLNIEYQDLIIP